MRHSISVSSLRMGDGTLSAHSAIIPVNDLSITEKSLSNSPARRSGSTRQPLLVLLLLFPPGLESALCFIVPFIEFLFLRLQGAAPKSSKASDDGPVPCNTL